MAVSASFAGLGPRSPKILHFRASGPSTERETSGESLPFLMHRAHDLYASEL